MKHAYTIGTHVFHDEPNMNYVCNRIYSINGGDLEEIKDIAKRVNTLEAWTKEFLELARKAHSEKRFMQAAAYYRGANFYISPGDPDKARTYESCVSIVRDIFRNDFENGVIQEEKVPYEKGYMPVWHVKALRASGPDNIVVMHLGYDSIKEELLPTIYFFREAGLELYLFEGPGQGETLYRHGIEMTPEWEKPVGAVLDYFRIGSATLIGLSLGGYLAPRAAVFEPRIKRVIAWGVMLDFFNVVTSRRGKFLQYLIQALMAIKAAPVINAIMRIKMKRDTYARWGVEHGMYVLGAKNPYQYFMKLKCYSMEKISHLVKQDFLLLGSTHDHFIPWKHFFQQAELLTNVKSFTGRIFTSAEKAENHVNFGNVPLVMNYMIHWIKNHSGSEGKTLHE